MILHSGTIAYPDGSTSVETLIDVPARAQRLVLTFAQNPATYVGPIGPITVTVAGLPVGYESLDFVASLAATNPQSYVANATLPLFSASIAPGGNEVSVAGQQVPVEVPVTGLARVQVFLQSADLNKDVEVGWAFDEQPVIGANVGPPLDRQTFVQYQRAPYGGNSPCDTALVHGSGITYTAGDKIGAYTVVDLPDNANAPKYTLRNFTVVDTEGELADFDLWLFYDSAAQEPFFSAADGDPLSLADYTANCGPLAVIEFRVAPTRPDQGRIVTLGAGKMGIWNGDLWLDFGPFDFDFCLVAAAGMGPWTGSNVLLWDAKMEGKG